jgi:hypothetical protein
MASTRSKPRRKPAVRSQAAKDHAAHLRKVRRALRGHAAEVTVEWLWNRLYCGKG